MKNIKYPLIIFLQLFVIQLIAQDAGVLDNGRSSTTVPNALHVEKAAPAAQSTDAFNEIDDADIPGNYYLRGGADNVVVYGDDGPTNLLERLENMETQLEE